MKSDIQIQKDVIDQLKWEPILNAAQIGVAVKNAVVTLSGIVDNYPQKLAAEKVAKRVFGVKAVAEDIQVGLSVGFTKSDTEIADACVNALKWHTSIPEDKLKVKVENGMVTLEGTTDWSFQRISAQSSVQNLVGVKGVNNRIIIKQRVSGLDVKQKIKDSFLRTAGTDAENIVVESLGDKIILRGHVRSFIEKEDAEHAAWAAPGVNSVDNKLEIVYKEMYESV